MRMLLLIVTGGELVKIGSRLLGGMDAGQAL